MIHYDLSFGQATKKNSPQALLNSEITADRRTFWLAISAKFSLVWPVHFLCRNR